MADYPILGAHLHVWDTARCTTPRCATIPLRNTSYPLGDDDRACGPEADFAPYHEEAAWVRERACQDPRLQGIVSWAPLEKGAVARLGRRPKKLVRAWEA